MTRGGAPAARRIAGAAASFALLGLLCATGAAGCGVEQVTDGATDRYVEPVVLEGVGPAVILPGSTLLVRGRGFAHPDLGPTYLELRSEDGAVDLSLEVDWAGEQRLEVQVDRVLFDALGGGGTFAGGARIVHRHSDAARTRRSTAIAVRWRLEATLAPPSAVGADDSIFVNDPVRVGGGGVLLGGGEGETRARVWGCFFPEGSVEAGCRSVEPVEVVVTAESGDRRQVGAFPFAPQIAGVGPGRFRGTVTLINHHGPEAGSQRLESAPTSFEVRLRRPAIHDVSTARASLGQYVEVAGGGFVGAHEDAVTLLEIRGTFRSARTGSERPVDVLLVPEFATGRHLRYVLSEDDPLGRAVSLRREHGTLTGTVQPVVRFGALEERGGEAPFAFELAPLKQVVVLGYQPSYAESLRRFGVRAADRAIRERILRAASEPYRGVNVDIREQTPEDFVLYAHVDLAGPDPNGTGLFGYDNTPGKDTNNLRLHDRIGGVNATTQLDGYPGYGGVFVESFLGFSESPPAGIEPLPTATDAFDAVFDPFRPDRGGRPIAAEELGGPLPTVRDGRECPAAGDFRPGQIACAIWVLGNLIGSTVAHELGHSLGLAKPHGEGFHNDGDLPGRLMDAGGARPFEERARIGGSDGAGFCAESFEYLRDIMPSGDEDPLWSRPSCD